MLAAFVMVLLLIDWRQTLRIARNPERWFERNPLLGAHPTTARVHMHFVMCAVATVGLAIYLPMFLWVVAAAEAVCVANNFRIGLKP